MRITFRTIELRKRVPLVISRGPIATTRNLFVMVDADGVQGVGELAPSPGPDAETAESGEKELGEFLATTDLDGLSIHEIAERAERYGVRPRARAALDVALWDWFARLCGQPLYRLFGLPLPHAPTSVTVGIMSPEEAAERAAAILRETGALRLKVKLGSPEGIEADRAMFAAVREAVKPLGVLIRVDANGGWTPGDARRMLRELAEAGVEFVEQPLPEGSEDRLPELYRDRPLPIIADESCRTSRDIPRLADRVDGVNIKLMKCGGLTEALRLAATARAHDLRLMIGCMSESSVAIAAGACISGLCDYIDLDSHLNLENDPAEGPVLCSGVVLPPDRPGHGARWRSHVTT